MPSLIQQTEIKDLTREVKTLIQTYSGKDPRLYQAVNLLADQLEAVTQVIVPMLEILGVQQQFQGPPDAPTNFQYQILEPGAIRLSWDRPNQSASFSFEIRAGVIWETASFITRTQSTVADVVPIAGQSNVFLLKSIDASGNYSTDAAMLIVIVEPPEAVALEGQVIDNNVLLKWTPALSTFPIDYYEVSRGSIILGRVKATFAAFFEMLSGEYTYSVVPIDIIGNRGQSSQVTLLVNQPPDYVLTSSILSKFQGTRRQALLVNDPLLNL